MSATTNIDELSRRFPGDVGVFNMEEHCQQFKVQRNVKNDVEITVDGEVIDTSQ